MKRTIALILAVAMMLTLVPVTAFAATEGITVTATKTEFNVGETIPLSNFSVTYTPATGTPEAVSENLTVNGGASVSFTQPGTQRLSIAYQTEAGKTLYAALYVNICAAKNSIAVSLSKEGEAALAAPVQGDEVKKTYFIVSYYEAGASAPTKTLSSEEFTIDATTLKAAGDNKITFKYDKIEGVYTVTGVLPKNDPALIISGTGRTQFSLGEPYDPAGLTFIYQPSNSTYMDQVVLDYGDLEYSQVPFASRGEQTITFSYTNPEKNETVTATQTVNVVGKLKSISFTSKAYTFYAGDTFSPKDMNLVATVAYQDGYKDEAGNTGITQNFADAVNDDFSWSELPLVTNQKSITVTYTDPKTKETISGDVAITVVSNLKKLELTAGGIKTYYIGEAFDPTGLTFTLTYADGTTEDFVGTTAAAYSKLSWASGAFTTAGNYKLPVSYTDPKTKEEVSCDLVITILDPNAAKLEAATVEKDLTVVVGDEFVPDELFDVLYQKENTEEFAELSYAKGDYTISPKISTFTTVGVQTFTITKDKVSTTVSLEVLPVIKQMTVTGINSLNLYGGDEFNPTGLTVSVVYNAGSLWNNVKKGARWPQSTTLSSGLYTFSADHAENGLSWPTDKLRAGEQTLTLTYTDPASEVSETAEITFTVKALLKELKISGTAGEYYADEPFALQEQTIEVLTNKGETIAGVVDADLNYDRNTLRKAGRNEIEISYTHADSGETVSCTYTFDVKAPNYTLKSASKPTRDKYTEGEMFDPAGLSWVITKEHDSTNTPQTITSGFACYPDRPLTPADSYVTVVYGDIAKVYQVTVTARKLTGIKITQNPDLASFYVGQRFDPTGMVVTATYDNKTTAEVTGYTYDTAVFTDSDIGTKAITISYKENGTTVQTTYNASIVAAPVRIASLVLSKSTLTVTESKTDSLTATVYPADATNKSLVWTSSNTSVARVDQAGVITAVGTGACVITASTTDGSNRYADCYVVVNSKVDVTKLVLKASTMELLVDDTTTLTATISPENATWNTATWTSSDPETVSVTAEGQIKGLKEGSATITASADGVSASVTIKVVKELTKYGTVVNCSRRVNVRKSPDGGAKQVGYAYLGDNYVVVGESGSWYKIQYGSDYAYIWKDYIELSAKSYVSDSDAAAGDTTTGDTTTGGTTTDNGAGTVYTTLTVVNCKRYVYVRKGPSTATSKAGHAKPGETYKLLGQTGSWYIIEYNGAQCYIYNSFGKLS